MMSKKQVIHILKTIGTYYQINIVNIDEHFNFINFDYTKLIKVSSPLSHLDEIGHGNTFVNKLLFFVLRMDQLEDTLQKIADLIRNYCDERERKVLFEHYIHDYSLKSIASSKNMDICYKTLKRMHLKAIQKLQIAFDENLEGELL